jgi:hypothetical protein
MLGALTLFRQNKSILNKQKINIMNQSKIENGQPELKLNSDSIVECSPVSPSIANAPVIGGFVWVRTGSFLDQIKDVWKLSLNDKVLAVVTVNTINFCTIEIFKETHKAVHGIENAKKYVELYFKQKTK